MGVAVWSASGGSAAHRSVVARQPSTAGTSPGDLTHGRRDPVAGRAVGRARSRRQRMADRFSAQAARRWRSRFDRLTSVSRSRFGVHAVRHAGAWTLYSGYRAGQAATRRAARSRACTRDPPMIAAILAFHIASSSSPSSVVLSYREVPGAVVSVELFEWRNGEIPRRIRLQDDISIEQGATSVSCRPGNVLIVTFLRRDAAYLVDGPFVCPPGDSGRRLGSIWQKTMRVRAPPEAHPPAEVTWLSATGDVPDAWPRCVWSGMTTECWGVPVDARGVLTFAGVDRTWWTVLAGRTPADFAGSAWGRLVIVGNGSATGRIVASIARVVAPRAERAASVRLDTAVVSDASAILVAPNVVWIHGGEIPAASWIEVRGERAGPAYLALDEVAHGPPGLPLWITLDE